MYVQAWRSICIKDMEERIFRNWLCNYEYLTDRQRVCLAEQYRDFDQLLGDEQNDFKEVLGKQAEDFKACVEQYRTNSELLRRAKGLYDKQVEQGIFFCHMGEESFPEKLRDIPDPPLGLFYRGKLPEKKKSVAIIGARDCTPYGANVAKELGYALGEEGVQVISGMARGIDGIAQEAALRAGGTSYGVFGCGVDICYPKSNQTLYDTLLMQGGMMSTYAPGTKPIGRLFPPRNRIVSGLSDIIIVIEAGVKSGTLITVDMALEQGREVYVVPGRITDRLSIGCNRLLSQGAGLLWNIPQFVAELVQKDAVIVTQPHHNLGELEVVYSILDDTPKSVEEMEILLSGKLDIRQLNIFLMRLVLEGLAFQPSPGYFCRNSL